MHGDVILSMVHVTHTVTEAMETCYWLLQLFVAKVSLFILWGRLVQGIYIFSYTAHLFTEKSFVLLLGSSRITQKGNGNMNDIQGASLQFAYRKWYYWERL